MMGILRWILTVVCLSALLTWGLLNRMDVTFDMSPAHDPFKMPLFGVIFLSAAIGFIWGALLLWLNNTQMRRELRSLRRANKQLQSDAADATLLPAEGPALRRGWFSRPKE